MGICLFLQSVLANLHVNTCKTTVATLTTIVIMMMTMIVILTIMIMNPKSASKYDIKERERIMRMIIERERLMKMKIMIKV